MSSANRERRKRNREARTVAVEEALRKSRRQRVTVVAIGLILAVAVAVVLVARARSGSSSAASTTTTTAADTTTTAAATTTTLASVAGKPCVAESSPSPAGAPAVPVQVGPPPKTLVKQDLKAGTGAVVKATSTLTVNYVGVACSNGKIFGSSYPGQPFTTPLSSTVTGWQQGLLGMKVGGERLLGIPSAQGYGPQGYGSIAPNEPLWFVVQLLKVQ